MNTGRSEAGNPNIHQPTQMSNKNSAQGIAIKRDSLCKALGGESASFDGVS